MHDSAFDHPYSDAVVAEGLVFVSGCLPVDEDENLVEGADALDAALGMVSRRLASVGCQLGDVVKMTYFVTDIGVRAEANAQYERTWPEPRPARTMIQVPRLPRDASVEIDVIARAAR